MTTPAKPLRSQEIRLCGHRLAIRTDLDEKSLEKIVAFAEERLSKQGGYALPDEAKRLFLPFLQLSGEFMEREKRLSELENRILELDARAAALVEQLDVAFSPKKTDIESG